MILSKVSFHDLRCVSGCPDPTCCFAGLRSPSKAYKLKDAPQGAYKLKDALGATESVDISTKNSESAAKKV